MKVLFVFFGICVLTSIVACATTEGPTGYSEKTLTIASLDMFSQQEAVKSGKSWSGDWQFRRDRLDLIDSTLRDVKPDVFVMQNAMRRAGSVSESDELILKSGALNRYEWKESKIEFISESGEDRLLAIAIAKPYAFDPSLEKLKNYFEFGSDGAVMIQKIKSDDGPILIFNVQMPSKMDQAGLWYSLLEDKIRHSAMELDTCLERVVVAGYLPFDQDSKRFKEFMLRLNLKDSGIGFCQNADRCQTASIQNGIFYATRGDEGSSQVDRVVTHKWSVIYSAESNFMRSTETSEYKESYGLTRVWSSQRYGWMTRIRLPICTLLK